MVNSSSTIPAGYEAKSWHASARSGVLLVGIAIAMLPFVQQVWNVLAAAGAPRQFGPVSATAVIVMTAMLVGAAGLKKLGTTPLPDSRWLRTFVMGAIGVIVLGNKILSVTWIQSLATLGMMTAGIAYMMKVDKLVRPEATRGLWLIPIVLIWTVGALIVAQRFVDADMVPELAGAAGMVSFVNVPFIIAPFLGLRRALV